MEVVFFQDLSRRTIPILVVDVAGETLAITTGPASVIPDGTGHAIDANFLHPVQQPGDQAAISCDYHNGSTSELFAYHTRTGLKSSPLPKAVVINVNDSLSAVMVDADGRPKFVKDATTVKDLQGKAEWDTPTNLHFKSQDLIVVDHSLHEGTLLYKGEELVGITLLGTRFIAGKKPNRSDANTSYVVPVGRIAALIAKLAKAGARAQQQAPVEAAKQPNGN